MSHRIRILSFTDVHGAIFPHSYADNSARDKGLAKLKTLIDFLRDDNTIVIDNGDSLEGTPLTMFHYRKYPRSVCPVTSAIREIEVDFVNVGNHDFNYGKSALFAHLSACGAKCITKNILHKGEPITTPFAFRDLAGKRIAFFGVTTQHIPHWEIPDHIRDITFLDAYETVRDTVAKLRSMPPADRPDFIVCAYHGGFERDPETGQQQGIDTGENEGYRMLTEIDGLDVLIAGHQHRLYKGKCNGTVYTQSGSDGAYLSVIDIDTFSRKITPRLIPVTEEADERLLKVVQKEEDACQLWLDEAIGKTGMDLRIHDENDARLHKPQFITYLNRAQMRMSGAELSACALFSGAKGFPETITMRDVVSNYPYPNTLVMKLVTGKVLRMYLEQAATYWAIGEDGEICVADAFLLPVPAHFNYDMVDGVDYTIKVSNPKGSRIVRLERNGEAVKDEDTFLMAVNNYRASGGGGYDMIVDAPTVSDPQLDVTGLIAEDIYTHPHIAFEPVHNIEIIK